MRKQPIVLTLALTALLAGCGDASDEEQLEPVGEAEVAETPAPAPATPAPATPAAGGAYDESALPAGVTMAMVEQGQQLYSGGPCVACHGPAAEGTTLGPNLTDAEWLNVSDGSYDGIVGVINNGVQTPVQYPGMMPPKGGGTFTEDQVRALAAYVYMLGHRA